MSILSSLASFGLKDLVLGVLDRIKLPPEKRAEIELQLSAHRVELARMEAELETKLAETAGANIRAEAAADSWLSKNSRPFFIFGGGATILANVWIPLISQFTARPVQPLELAEWFYATFAFGFGGYAGFRSWEKVTKLKNGQAG